MDRIQEGVIAGRALTPRYKQRQLEALHQTLLRNRSALEEAILNDTKVLQAEATAQWALTCHAVKVFFEALDFDKLLEAEYNIANSKDNVSRRTAIGYVYIVPETQSLYSHIVPLAAAVAAGNCVALEIKQTLSKLGGLLKSLLQQALDSDTFAVVQSEGSDKAFKQAYGCHVDCGTFQDGRVAAVVDRTADIEKAAQDLVRARMSFRGLSTYAPDFVLVNEFCVDNFCKAAVQAVMPYLTRASGSNEKRKRGQSDRSNSSYEDADLMFLSAGGAGSVAIANDRKAFSYIGKVSEPLLIIIPSSSMDDAIDFIYESTAKPLQALYTFGAPSFSKYLSQFIQADLSFANHIPVELLVGPAAPRLSALGSSSLVSSLAPQVHPRYTPEMFSIPRPEYIESRHSPLSESLMTLLSSPNAPSVAVLSKLSEAVQKPQFKEPNKGAIGYFEQGIMTGGAILLSTIVIGTTCAIKYGYPFLARVVRTQLSS